MIFHDDAGIDYMVMEFIVGKTLDADVPRRECVWESVEGLYPIADAWPGARAGIIHSGYQAVEHYGGGRWTSRSWISVWPN